jgi:hypothetical protein
MPVASTAVAVLSSALEVACRDFLQCWLIFAASVHHMLSQQARVAVYATVDIADTRYIPGFAVWCSKHACFRAVEILRVPAAVPRPRQCLNLDVTTD